MTLFLFAAFAGVLVASALLVILHRHPVTSALFLVLAFCSLAGLYLLLGAEFVGMVQVIVYAGAILVFYLFFLMLLDLPHEAAEPPFGAHWPLCAGAGLGFAALAWYSRDVGLAPTAERTAAAGGPPPGSLAAVGTALFTQFVLPFEIASLILLAAIVGAIVVARKKATS